METMLSNETRTRMAVDSLRLVAPDATPADLAAAARATLILYSTDYADGPDSAAVRKRALDDLRGCDDQIEACEPVLPDFDWMSMILSNA